MSKTCGECGQDIQAQAPTYPVTCGECGVQYGPGGEVTSHRPGSDNCKARKLRGLTVVEPTT